MPRYIIEGVGKTFYGTTLRFNGFRLQGVVGEVDPFVDGVLLPHDIDELKRFFGDDNEIIQGMEEGFLAQELSWANKQIGKYLECGELRYKAFATGGEVRLGQIDTTQSGSDDEA